MPPIGAQATHPRRGAADRGTLAKLPELLALPGRRIGSLKVGSHLGHGFGRMYVASLCSN
jgi:hypothetical protein